MGGRTKRGGVVSGGVQRATQWLALVLVTSAVILLIVDLDRPQEGLLQVSQQTLIDLQRQFEAWP